MNKIGSVISKEKNYTHILLQFDIGLKLRIVNARTVDSAILELIEKEHFDLLVLGAKISGSGATKGAGPIVEKILKSSICPVWICCSTSK